MVLDADKTGRALDDSPPRSTSTLTELAIVGGRGWWRGDRESNAQSMILLSSPVSFERLVEVLSVPIETRRQWYLQPKDRKDCPKDRPS